MNVKLQHTALPTDISAAIRQFKQQIRQQIGDVEGLFRQVCQRTEQAISDAKAEERLNGSAWPVISPEEITQGLTPETRESIKRRGCVVVKQHFPREQALAWDTSMLRYLDENQFDAQYRGPGDNFSAAWKHPALKSIPFTGLTHKWRRVRVLKWPRCSHV